MSSEQPRPMIEPSVSYLRFELIPEDENVAVELTQPVDVETDDFRVRIGTKVSDLPGIVVQVSHSAARVGGGDGDDALREAPVPPPVVEVAVTFKRRFSTVEDALASVRPYLAGWALNAHLNEGLPRFRFDYAGSLLSDAQDPKRYEVISKAGSFRVVAPSVTLYALPDPPSAFRADESTMLLWERWRAYLDGKAELPATAYAVLTYLESTFGPSRSDVAHHLRVSRRVLDTVGRLTSDVGDPTIRRKFSGAGPHRPYTNEEKRWLEAALLELIRRVGSVAGGQTPATLDMAGLPPVR